jgi:hypothetical protein
MISHNTGGDSQVTGLYDVTKWEGGPVVGRKSVSPRVQTLSRSEIFFQSQFRLMIKYHFSAIRMTLPELHKVQSCVI